LQAKRGIAKLATGAGKTEIAIAITKALNIPTLFLTHRVNLLYQTAKRYIARVPELKGRVSVIGDGNYETNFITIATVQTLYNLVQKDREQAIFELSPFQLLIIDEAHHSGASQFYETANCCVNAYFRLALTATPFMGTQVESMYLKGITGDIFDTVSAGFLVEKGVLARPFFKFIRVDKPDNLKKLSSWHDIYNNGIVNNEYRNNLIVSKIAELKKYNILCIVDRVKHGQILKAKMKEKGIRAKFLNGSHAYDQRTKALDDLSKGKINAIIATNIFDEGIDVNDINCIVLAAGNKSAPAIYQRTGRAMRKKEADNYALVIDFVDTTHEKLLEHSTQRYRTVKNESGFVIL
jgi:superfamily II DNA or RNA helicase